MTPIERAARALHQARMARQHPKPDNFPWESLTPKQQALLRVDVHAVVRAIREPSEQMLAAAQGVDFVAPGENDAAGEWRAMIDQMLDESRAAS